MSFTLVDWQDTNLKMKTLLAVCILFGSLVVVTKGQPTCNVASLPSFTLAATRMSNQGNINQYFVIGGMFDIHQIGPTAYQCSTGFSDIGFINMVAFFWGINRYFYQTVAARTLSVGAVAFDNCMRPDQTIQNMYDYAQCRIYFPNMLRDNVVAYVGPYMNDDAKMAGALAEDLGITVFSPMADTDSINYMDQKTLLKMRPSFMYDLKAIVEFLNKVNASFVIILYSGNDPYWRDAYESLTTMITSNKAVTTCIQYTADVDNVPMANIIANLANKQFVKYIVPLTSKDSLSSVMQGLLNNLNYIFIINSRIGRDLLLMSSSQVISYNSIIVEPIEPDDYMPVLTEFNTFLAGLNRNDTTPGLIDGVGNVWLGAFLNSSKLPNLTDPTVPSPLAFSVYRTLLSVKAIMRGMDSALIKCGTQGSSTYQFCSTYRNLQSKATNLYESFRTTTDNYLSNSGDLKYVNCSYSYYIFSVNDGSKFIKIGNLTVNSTGGVSASISNLKDTSLYGNSFGDSTCPQLGIGQCCEFPITTTAPTTANINGTAATASTPTAADTLSQVGFVSGQVITGAYSNAPRMDRDYGTRFDIGQKWIIALGVLAGLGILCVVVFEVYILYKLLGTPTGSKWRTMWLGQLLLFGVFLCYIVLFAYLPIPTKATCGITRFGVGVSYAFCFSVLLVKLMVILTSKPSDVLLPGDIETPNYLKGTYQFLLFLLSLGVQIVIDVQWLITIPPEAVLVTSNNGDQVWVCNHYTWQVGSAMDMRTFVRTNFENHLMSLIYVMVLILITTILSLKAHGIITNHRESIFVGIAAGFTIPIWLAWGLVGGLNKTHLYAQEFGDASIAFGLLSTATLILFSMFLPKVRHLVNMGVEGIYLEDDLETIVGGGSVIMAPSYKSKGSGSVIYVNNQGIFTEPVVISNGDPTSNHLKHPGSVYSAPGNYLKHPESIYGGSTRVMRVTDLRGRHPQKRSQSEIAYGSSRRPLSHKGTMPRSRSQTQLGAL